MSNQAHVLPLPLRHETKLFLNILSTESPVFLATCCSSPPPSVLTSTVICSSSISQFHTSSHSSPRFLQFFTHTHLHFARLHFFYRRLVNLRQVYFHHFFLFHEREFWLHHPFLMPFAPTMPLHHHTPSCLQHNHLHTSLAILYTHLVHVHHSQVMPDKFPTYTSHGLIHVIHAQHLPKEVKCLDNGNLLFACL